MSRQSGRPRKHGDRLNTNVRFEPELHERLRAAAEERDLSVNYLVNQAVREFPRQPAPRRRDPLDPRPMKPPDEWKRRLSHALLR